MEGYKKIEALIKLKKIKEKGIPLFIGLFLLNALAWRYIEPSVLFEIGMFSSLGSLLYFLLDYRGF